MAALPAHIVKVQDRTSHCAGHHNLHRKSSQFHEVTFQRVHICVVLGEVEGQVDAECVHLLVWIVRILHTHAAITFAHAPLHYLCLALAQIELVFLRLHRPPAHPWLLLPTQGFGLQLSKGSHVVRLHRQRNVVRVNLECGLPLLPRLLGDPHLQGGRLPCFLRSIFSDCC